MLILAGVNIAHRALSIPELTSLGQSPQGAKTSARLAEMIDRELDAAPYWFQQATHIATVTTNSGNRKDFIGGEDVEGATSGATFTLICIDKGRMWLRLKDGTPSGSGETVTGATTGATRVLSTAYTQLDPDTAWSFENLPEPFAHWIAQAAGLDIQRERKRGQVDEGILGRQVQSARVRAEDFDSGWQGWTIHSQPDLAKIRENFNRGPGRSDPYLAD